MGTSLFGVDFNTGALIDTSGNGIKFTHGSASAISNGRYFLDGLPESSGGNHISIARDPSLYSQKQLTVGMDFQTATVGKGGHIFSFHDSLDITVTDSGEVMFRLIGNQAGQSGQIVSSGAKVTDGGAHSFKLNYDAVAGKMTGYVDGKAVGSVAVSAPMKAASYWDGQIGTAWTGGFKGYVDNVHIANGDGVLAGTAPVPAAAPTPAPTADTGSGTSTGGKLLFAADFASSGQLINTAAGSPVKITHGTGTSVQNGTYLLDGANGGNYLSLSRDPSLFSQKQLDITLDFKVAAANKGGHIFNMMDSLSMDVTDQGQARFTLVGNAAGQKGIINTTGLKIADGGWHNLRLNYDAVAGKMTGYVDGKAVGSFAVTAATKAAASWDPIIGDAWSGAFRGNIDNIKVSSGWGSGTTTSTNTLPVGAADKFTMAEDTSLSMKLAGLLANDSDANGDALSITGASLASGQGTVQFNAGSDIVFTPTKDWFGNAVVNYTLSDGKGGVVTVPVNITVTQDAPTPPPAGGTTDQLFNYAKTVFAKPILVNSTAELLTALQKATGGETILLRSDVDYKVVNSTWVAHSSTVTVTSLDPSKMANLTGLELRNANNITFDNVKFEFKGTPGQGQVDVQVLNSTNITISDSVLKGTATAFAYNDSAADAVNVYDTNGFQFVNNEVSNFYYGLNIHRSANIVVQDTDMHHMQADGMRFSQDNGVIIENNWIHEFLGADANLNHNDYIQFWTAGTSTGSQNIVIRGNLLANGGTESQAIFMRDEAGDAGNSATRYKNVLIENNFIENNHAHGITIGRVDGITINDNTLGVLPGGNYNMLSNINVSNATGVRVFDNYVPKVNITSSSIVTNSNNLVPSKLTAIIAAENIGGNAFDFDARYTINQSGWVKATDARFVWDFGDGSANVTAQKVSKTFSDSADHVVTLTVLHNDGTSDTAAVRASHADFDAVQDANGSLGFLHIVDPWGV